MLAELVRPRGNKGELLAVSQTDVPGRLETLKRAWIQDRTGRVRPVEIESAWRHKEFWVLKFAGVDSIGDAEEFAGLDLWVPRGERGELGPGEHFRTDLIGFDVVLADSGTQIGRVAGWQQYGGPPLMELEQPGKPNRQLLIPFVEPICREVDLDGRRIVLDPPEGLLDL